MTAEVVCFYCDARNRVPEGWSRLRGIDKEDKRSVKT